MVRWHSQTFLHRGRRSGKAMSHSRQKVVAMPTCRGVLEASIEHLNTMGPSKGHSVYSGIAIGIGGESGTCMGTARQN